MATLNRYEQEKIDAYETLEARRRAGENVGDFELNRAKAIAEQQRQNAELRAERIASLHADRAAQAAAHQLRADQQALAAQEAYLRQARIGYTGTEAQWQQEKDEILRQWRIRNAVETEAARRLVGLEY